MTFSGGFVKAFRPAFDLGMAARIVTAGLVLHYDAAVTGESNTVVNLADAPNGSLDGSLAGSSPKLASGTPVAYKMELNYFVTVAETATLRIAQPTVEWWGYLVSGTKTAPPWASPATQACALVTYGMGSPPYYRYRLGHTSNTNDVTFDITVGSTLYAASAAVLNKPEWVHLVGTYNGETVLLYRNGYEIARNETPSGDITWPNYNNWNIGTWNDHTMAVVYSQTNFTGNKWSVTRLYNRALTAAEVYQNWSAQRSRFGL